MATNLDKYVRGRLPDLPESRDKYLQEELRKLERQSSNTYEKVLLTEEAVNGMSAEIEIERTVRASETEALAQQIETISVTGARQSSFYQTTAPLSPIAGDIWIDSDDGNKLYVYSNGSWVSVDNALLATNAASIVTEQTARINADGNLATQINTVSASASRQRVYRQSSAPTTPVTGDYWIDTSDSNKPKYWSGSAWLAADDLRVSQNSAAISTETTARVNADSALASQITNLNSTVNAQAASITNEASTRASADTALSSQLSTVSTTVNGQTASISTIQSSVNGITGRYGVTINNNGHISGISLLSETSNGTPSSVFRVAADQFAIRTPGAATDSVFWDSATSKLKVRGDVEATSVTIAAVGTDGIALNSVTTVVGASNNGTVFFQGGATSWTPIVSLTINSGGAPIYVVYSIYELAVFQDVNKVGGRVYAYMDGVSVGAQGHSRSKTVDTVYDGDFAVTKAFIVQNPGTGNKTFTLYLDGPSASGATTLAQGTNIIALGLKR